MKRRAKIVATLGPASNKSAIIEKLILAGMNVARMNMSHGTHYDHAKVLKRIRNVSSKINREVAILLDLQGPKIRVDKLDQPLQLKKSEIWDIGTREKNKSSKKKNFIPTVYKFLVKDVEVGDPVLFDDGLIEAYVSSKSKDFVSIEVVVGGELKSNKGINLPKSKVSAPSLTDKDKDDLFFGLSQGVDFVAISFVRNADDILSLKKILHQYKSNVPVIAKVERPEAVKNIQEIIKVADGIMVARGDMGVEVGNHLVPSIQKMIINECNKVGRLVITATQMLESMIYNSRPTRAEASDVANAIWDGTDAVMLSGETASGKYPLETLKMMDKIIIDAELRPKERPLLRSVELNDVTTTTMVAGSLLAEKVYAKWIIAVSESGDSCLKLSRFRPQTSVLGISNKISAVRKMCLYWGITPYLFKRPEEEIQNLEYFMIDEIKAHKLVSNGDKVVITKGSGKYIIRGSSNSVRVEIIREVDPQSGKDGFNEVTIDGKAKIIHDTQICAQCHICVQTCPFDIWQISKEDRSTILNEKNASQCLMDMECVNNCPTGAIEIFNKVF